MRGEEIAGVFSLAGFSLAYARQPAALMEMVRAEGGTKAASPPPQRQQRGIGELQ